MNRLTSGRGAYGDLYTFSKVRSFRIDFPADMPDPKVASEAVSQHSVFLIGDCFAETNRGYYSFRKQLSWKIGREVYYGSNRKPRNRGIFNRRPPNDGVNPLYFFEDHQVRKGEQKKIFILESVERNILTAWGKKNFEQKESLSTDRDRQSAFSAWVNRLSYLLFDTENNYAELWENSTLTRPVLEIWNTWIFNFLGKISEAVPLYTVHPPFMFYEGEVKSFYEQHSDAIISEIAENILKLKQSLNSRYNTELVVMPIPNKYTIYHKLVRNDPYDFFLPRLSAELTKRGVKNVDLYSHFMREEELTYFPTDTHWNSRGAGIAVDETLKVLNAKV